MLDITTAPGTQKPMASRTADQDFPSSAYSTISAVRHDKGTLRGASFAVADFGAGMKFSWLYFVVASYTTLTSVMHGYI